MNTPEFQSWLDRALMLFDDVKRFVESRGPQQLALVEEWRKVLGDSEAWAANEVLDLMLSGDITRAEYFDVGRFAGMIAHEARAIAAHKIRTKQYGSEQSYTCAICRDSGLVNVWNPDFIFGYYHIFQNVSREEIDRDDPANINHRRLMEPLDPERMIACYRYTPATWLADAAAWWKGQGDNGGPIHHVALCDCNCQQQRMQQHERDKFLANERKIALRPLGLPACGMATYDPLRMPLKTAEPFNDLISWYQ